MKDYANVLLWAYPEASWTINESYGSIEWDSSNAIPKPTKKDLNKKWGQYKNIKDSLRYKKNRKREYPDVGEQLDAILKQLNYMQMNNQMDLIKPLDAVIGDWLAVKRKYPSPN